MEPPSYGSATPTDAVPGGQSSVYTIDARGGVPVKLPFHDIDDSAPAWSEDEQWMYLQSQSPDDFQIWKVPLAGDEEPVHLTGGMFPREGPNGRVLYWGWEPTSIWSLSATGGEPFREVNKRVGYAKWCLWEGNLVYIHIPPGGDPTIEMFNLETHDTTVITSLPAGTRTFDGLSVSPDGKWILYGQHDQYGSDLMLVERF